MGIVNEIKPKYHIIYWLNNGTDLFNVKECYSEDEMEKEVERIKNLYYNYIVSENIENNKYANSNSQYKILNRGNYPTFKWLRFLSGFMLFLILLYFLILFFNHIN